MKNKKNEKNKKIKKFKRNKKEKKAKRRREKRKREKKKEKKINKILIPNLYRDLNFRNFFAATETFGLWPSIATAFLGLNTDRISEKTSPPPVAMSKTELDFLINLFAIDL